MSLSVINRGGSILALAVAILILAPMGKAQTTEYERFQLFNDCEPMHLLVEGLHPDAAEIGLTRRAIQSAAERRLRLARLYSSDRSGPVPFLYVRADVIRTTFGVALEYNKWLADGATGLFYPAATWDQTIFGAHGRDASYILSAVSELIDDFLLDYLRVNEEAC